MPEPTGEPADDRAVRPEPFMVVDRIAQVLITQKLNAALEQLEIIAEALREDGRRRTLSPLYANTVEARQFVEAALKELPWTPLPGEEKRQVTGPPPALT
jgi:hypothetical protein